MVPPNYLLIEFHLIHCIEQCFHRILIEFDADSVCNQLGSYNFGHNCIFAVVISEKITYQETHNLLLIEITYISVICDIGENIFMNKD